MPIGKYNIKLQGQYSLNQPESFQGLRRLRKSNAPGPRTIVAKQLGTPGYIESGMPSPVEKEQSKEDPRGRKPEKAFVCQPR